VLPLFLHLSDWSLIFDFQLSVALAWERLHADSLITESKCELTDTIAVALRELLLLNDC